MSAPRIFVSIAAYRDAECVPTILDLFAKATNPELVAVGVCWQAGLGDAPNPRTINDARIRMVEINAMDSRGACWARAQTQMLWQGEEWVLQIDSHMRFEPNWDQLLYRQWAMCQNPRAVLSQYPIGYEPPHTLTEKGISQAIAAEFEESGLIRVSSKQMCLEDAPIQPIPSAFVAGGFVFGPSAWITECPYDPHLYFWGEELTMAARLWTHGFDIYAPCEVILYHDYTPRGGTRIRHWDDHKGWGALNTLSLKRACHLLGAKTSDDPQALLNLDRYGMGAQRSLEAFYDFSGVNYRDKTIYGMTHAERQTAGVIPA